MTQAKPISVDTFCELKRLLKEENRGGAPVKIRPYEYPPVSFEMKTAMDAAGWGETEVAEFFGGTRELLSHDGKRWVYGPMWDYVPSKGDGSGE